MHTHTTGGARPTGLRPSTAAGRAALCCADNFAGLPEGIGRWRVMAAVRTAARQLDLSPMMLRLLEHYVDLTWDIDWTVGNEPIVHRPLVEIAAALGRSERQIRNVERALAARGLLAWRDSGNHHRHGRRDHRTGRLLYGYGVTLGPMGARAREILALAETARREAATTRRLRIAISALRRRLHTALEAATACGVTSEVIQSAAATLSTVPPRARATDTLTMLQQRHDHLAAAATMLNDALNHADASRLPVRSAPKEEISDREYTDTESDIAINGYSTQAIDKLYPLTNKSKPIMITDCNDRSKALHQTNRRNITISLAIACTTREAKTDIEFNNHICWNGMADTMQRRCMLLDIDQETWAQGCSVIGRIGTTLCAIIVDHGSNNSKKRRIQHPSAYFRALISRAERNQLNLEASLFAIARRKHYCPESYPYQGN